MNILKDPVCGTAVTPESPFHQVHDGAYYWFCSEFCEKKFEQDPAAYAGQAHATHDHGHGEPPAHRGPEDIPRIPHLGCVGFRREQGAKTQA
ncbi:MAG TPA: YHS domain-containing protein [Gammaproteobacteria bacterium]|nr:YHS domain-containing protein [Gammaproteobacteria bacterium]